GRTGLRPVRERSEPSDMDRPGGLSYLAHTLYGDKVSAMTVDRRKFIAAAAVSTGRILGANDRVRVGLIGCGGRGRYVAGFMREAPNAEFSACADVFLPNAERAREWAGPQAKAYQDFRKLLESKDVDAVLVATPDHWHAGATVLACQAGK